MNIEIAQNKPRGIPEFIGEVAASLKLLLAQPHIVARGAAGGQGKAQGIGAVFIHCYLGVEHILARFAHLIAFLVSNESMKVNLAERNLAGVLQAHHDHPSHPEEEDIVAGLQHRGGIEIAQISGIIRPAEGGMRPEGRAEPGVQYIGILQDVRRAAMGTSVGVVHSHRKLPAILAVPDGEAMSPPELPTDAPVTDTLHPVEVYPGETLGDDLNASVNHRFDGGNG
ncbi:MAG: hypothetical protein DDT26_00876 [Dehalococcoidia bacterium]|nr:hypothetical protein [Chloroflexota bacterium]